MKRTGFVLFLGTLLAAPTAIQITPYSLREQLPFPLADATVTTYGFSLEPSDTTFAPVPAVRNPTVVGQPVGVGGHPFART
jgi:hypothetical protein